MRRAGVAGVVLVLVVGGCATQTAKDPGLCDDPTASPTVDDPSTRPLAFASNRSGSFDLWLMGADGSDPVRLTTSPDAEGMPSWSPDGTRLAFISAPTLNGMSDICVINADGTGLKNLTGTADVYETTPVWSPDGTQIAFGIRKDDSGEILVMDTDGQGQQLLTAAEDNWPSWSPDGRILFSSSRDGHAGQLWVMNRDGGDQTRLTDRDTETTEPAWSPDGQDIAFVSESGEPDAGEDVFVMDAGGGPWRRVTTLPGSDHWPPAWSPDSSRLAFTADGTENVGEIMVLDLASLEATNVTHNGAHDAFPAWRGRTD